MIELYENRMQLLFHVLILQNATIVVPNGVSNYGIISTVFIQYNRPIIAAMITEIIKLLVILKHVNFALQHLIC